MRVWETWILEDNPMADPSIRAAKALRLAAPRSERSLAFAALASAARARRSMVAAPILRPEVRPMHRQSLVLASTHAALAAFCGDVLQG